MWLLISSRVSVLVSYIGLCDDILVVFVVIDVLVVGYS